MSLHPPRTESKPAPRVTKKAWGMTVSAAHTRRPRILRLPPSKARGGASMRKT